MKFTVILFFLFCSTIALAGNELTINVKKVTALLERAENRGVTPGGAICYVELRTSEDGRHSVYTASENDQLFIGLDIEAYGRITSAWSKRSFSLNQRGFVGSQDLMMVEEFSSKKLKVHSVESANGQTTETICSLPLR